MKRLIIKANVEFDRSKFNDEQLRYIDNAIKDGLKIQKYLNPEISADQMTCIFDGLREELDVSWYDDWKIFNYDQMYEIYTGLLEGLSVSVYAKKDIDSEKMYFAKLALSMDLPIKPFVSKDVDVKYIELATNTLKYIKSEEVIAYLRTLKPRESNKAAEKLLNKIPKMEKSLHSYSYHDIPNRSSALVYFNGKFYTGTTHAMCLNSALKENKRESLSTDWYRPSNEELENVFQNQDKMFFANIVDSPYETSDNDGTDTEFAIYIIPNSELLVGVTLEEAAQIIKSSEEYNQYKVFKDSESYVDLNLAKRVFPRLAKLKNMKKLMKFIYG